MTWSGGKSSPSGNDANQVNHTVNNDTSPNRELKAVGHQLELRVQAVEVFISFDAIMFRLC